MTSPVDDWAAWFAECEDALRLLEDIKGTKDELGQQDCLADSFKALAQQMDAQFDDVGALLFPYPSFESEAYVGHDEA